MNLNAAKYMKIFISFMITLALLAFLYKAFLMFGDSQTIKDIKNIKGVSQVKLTDKMGKNAYITLNKVDNLMVTYQKIDDILKQGKYKINIIDKENTRLKNAYYDVQFALYEASARNDFVSMKATLDKRIPEYNIDNYKIFIDDNNIYVQMEQGSGYLYKVIPRH